jgi:hypothetical protein
MQLPLKKTQIKTKHSPRRTRILKLNKKFKKITHVKETNIKEHMIPFKLQ